MTANALTTATEHSLLHSPSEHSLNQTQPQLNHHSNHPLSNRSSPSIPDHQADQEPISHQSPPPLRCRTTRFRQGESVKEDCNWSLSNTTEDITPLQQTQQDYTTGQSQSRLPCGVVSQVHSRLTTSLTCLINKWTKRIDCYCSSIRPSIPEPDNVLHRILETAYQKKVQEHPSDRWII